MQEGSLQALDGHGDPPVGVPGGGDGPVGAAADEAQVGELVGGDGGQRVAQAQRGELRPHTLHPLRRQGVLSVGGQGRQPL